MGYTPLIRTSFILTTRYSCHVLCQMSCGYLPHARIMESMRRFGDGVIPQFKS